MVQVPGFQCMVHLRIEEMESKLRRDIFKMLPADMKNWNFP